LYLAGLDKGVRPRRDDIDDFLPWAIGGVILGGRLGYIFFYGLPHYLENPMDALMLWNGGMSFHGGALGVIIALFVFSAMRRIHTFRLADFVCAAVPIGLFFGRIANFINGELFGRVTDSKWGMVFPRGGEFPRHPSQLYEAALEGALLFLILFAFVISKYVRVRPGIVSGLFLAGYGVFRASLEFVREPDAQIGLMGGVITMGQVLSIPMIVAGLCMILYALSRGPLDDETNEQAA
jgi:phosphatidylglycerol:prolipoprotein diacylglycerol transferase